MKHLALVTTSFPDLKYQSIGDAAASFVVDLATELSRQVKVTVVAPSGESARERQDSFNVRRFRVPALPLSLLTPSHPENWPKIFATLRNGAKALEDLAATEKIDHIFALWVLPSGYWARRLWRKKKIPYSLWALGSDIWSLSRIPVVKTVMRSVLRDASTLFADGLILGKDVERLANGHRCHFLSSARQLHFPEPRPLSTNPPYNVAFLGRWHPNKGADILVRSLSLLEDGAWEAIGRLRYCGGGRLDSTIRPGLERLIAQGRPVSLEGYLNRQEATDLYNWADYLIIPSRIESIPVVFSDAIQGRAVVVSTPVGDLKQLIEEYGVGVVSDDTSPEAIAATLTKALQKPPVDFGSGLEKILSQFDVKKTAERFLNIVGLGPAD